jgi:hypothetical protein
MNQPSKRRGRPPKAICPNGAQGDPATAVIPGESLGRFVHVPPACETKGIFSEPEQDIAAGDKTPAVVEWRRHYWPKDQFDAVYPPTRRMNTNNEPKKQ